jgi:serine protease Do
MIKRPAFFLSGILFLTTVALAGTSFTTSQNQSIDEKQERPREVLVDFRELAKKDIPAVVSIKVTKKRSSYFGGNSDSGEESDVFGNHFWKFFNLPRQDLYSQPLSGQGSGFLVSADGYILTNSHVVNEMDTINVQLYDGRILLAKVLGQDKNSDLALIKVEGNDLPFLELGNSDDLEVGQWVAAIGNPFGLQATLTTGVVSAKGRQNLDIVPYEDFIQTDAAINSGNSGGPLVALDGKVIGINTAIATNSSASYMGIGFAIPSNIARYVMDEILKHGKVARGFLGVSLQSIDYNLAQAFDLKKVEGALVTSVVKGSPAERAGIKTEDIILKYNDRPVKNAAVLRNSMYMMPSGSKVVLTILRDGKIIQVPAEVTEFAAEEEKAPVLAKTNLGIEVDTLTPDMAQSLGYQEKGVIITKVQPGSPAAFVGLKKGSLILAINRQKVETKEQFQAALKETPQGRPALFQVKQGDINAFISIQVN